jgi:hypothetical protein
MVEEKLVVARSAGWNCDLDGQSGYEFSRVIERSRDAHSCRTGPVLAAPPDISRTNPASLLRASGAYLKARR